MTIVRGDLFHTVEAAPLRSTLLDHVEPQSQAIWGISTGVAQSFNCIDVNVLPGPCSEDWAPDPDPISKEFSEIENIDGVTATVQAGLSCGGFGFSPEEGEQHLRRVFTRRESKGAERAFLEGVLTDSTPVATDLTPASGPVGLDAALAIAEGYAADVYAGQPYLHAPSILASLAVNRKRAMAGEGDRFYTRYGSALVNGAGYGYPSLAPNGSPAEDGTVWLYVSGAPIISRGELIVRSAFGNPSSTGTTNDVIVLAERAYMLAVDCFVAAINVSLED